jgi:hypothetical protein
VWIQKTTTTEDYFLSIFDRRRSREKEKKLAYTVVPVVVILMR